MILGWFMDMVHSVHSIYFSYEFMKRLHHVYAKICCLCNEKLVIVMMTVPLPQLQSEKHFASVVTIVLCSVWITLKPFMTEIILSSLGSRVKRRPLLCQSSFGMADVWSTISHRGHCWPNCPTEFPIRTQDMFIYSLSVHACVYLSLMQTASQPWSTSVIQSSGWAHIQDQSSSLSLWRAIPSLRPSPPPSSSLHLSLALYLRRMFYF